MNMLSLHLLTIKILLNILGLITLKLKYTLRLNLLFPDKGYRQHA